MEISISKSEIFKEVEKRTVLESTRYPEQYDNLWATEYEAGFLDTYWIEGCSALINLLKRYIASVTNETVLSHESNDETLEIEAEMPERFDENLTGSIITDMKMMLVCNVLAGWLNVKNADLSKKYEDEALSYATGLAQKILFKTYQQMSYGETKDEDDVRKEDDSYQFHDKDEDDIDMLISENENMINKSPDKLKLVQYERCNNNLEPPRDNGGCNKCCACDW